MSYPSWCIAVLVVILAGCSGFSSNRGRMKQGIVLRDSISEDLVAGSLKEGKLDLKETFSALVRNKEFKEEVWQKKPYVCTSKLANIAGSFTMDDVQVNVDKDFVEAGRGTLEGGKGGWNMASVSTPRGNSFEEAKLRFQDVEMAMTKKSGTVVFNSAGGFIPPLAGVCLQTIEAFDLPAAINMYLTAPKQQVSAPPHTDKQEVFVLQTQGCKHWRIFSPPSPSKTPKADPYARGKGNDVLLLEELGEPLLDLVLSPGQMLYIPSGFPHTTDTLEGPCQDSTEASVHLTVGVDTHIWGLSYQALRSYALRRKGQWAKIRTEKLSPETYFSLQQALPLGFLSGVVVEQAGVAGFGAGMRAAIREEIVSTLLAKMREVEPSRWPAIGAIKIIEGGKEGKEGKEGAVPYSDLAMAEEVGAVEAVDRIAKHHGAVVDTMRRMYEDVAFRISPSKMDVSFFRSQPYFQQLEGLQSGLEAWCEVSEVSEVSTTAGAVETETGVGVRGGGGKGFGAKAKVKAGAKAKGFGK